MLTLSTVADWMTMKALPIGCRCRSRRNETGEDQVLAAYSSGIAEMVAQILVAVRYLANRNPEDLMTPVHLPTLVDPLELAPSESPVRSELWPSDDETAVSLDVPEEP